jgi:curli biogenesis system outer membrane secretion channel CsgG
MKLVLLFLSLFISFDAMAGVKYMEIEAEGQGISLGDAINSALIEAIGRVNGKSVDGVSVMQSLQIETATNEKNEYFASDAFARQVIERTKGAVSGYEIISKNEDTSGLWNVVVVAKIAKYQKSPGSERKRIAIMPLRNARSSFSLAGSGLSSEEVSRVLNQSLSNYLTQTRKFTVLDREYMEESASELALIGEGTPVAEMARLGEKMVADYMFVGTIEKVSYDEHTRSMRTSDKKVTYGAGDIELGFKLIEVATQQTVVSDKAKANFQDGGLAGAQASLSALADKAAAEASRIIMAQIYPVMMISVSGNDVVLNQGGNSISQGSRYKFYRYGEKIHDPYTKEYIGRQESYVGIIEITRINPKQSYGRIVESNIDLAANFEDRRFILREKIVSKKTAASKKISELKEKRKRKEASDDRW